LDLEERGKSMPNYVLGVDVGGTFTDAALIDTETGDLLRAKVSTTPDDQSRGTLATLPELGIDAGELSTFCHGTTVGINALLQRKGVKTGLICNRGMRDMLDAGRHVRDPEFLYDPSWMRPHLERPLVERRYIREIDARMLYDGSIYIEFDEEQVREQIALLRDEGVESVAVCLLNSYANPEHEERVLGLIREMMPDAYVQSSAVRPVIGEYARTAAAVIDAYTGPVVSDYLLRLDGAMQERGHRGPSVIMQMNGGVRTLTRTVEHFPAYTLASGPVGGLLGAEYFGRNLLDAPNLICVDIGGTSTDIGVVMDGRAQTVEEWEVEWQLPLGVPAVDVRSIGAGGGSIIQTDEMGTLRVGPESAGAQPGPAGYGRGGTEPTITDAHILSGALRPGAFLGGRMELDLDAAEASIAGLAERLVIEPHRLAGGAIELMNASIESEIAKLVFERGVDLRRFSLFAYGGAGALHVCEVALRAGVGEVIVPQDAGGFSALGLATAPPKVERAIADVREIKDFTIAELRTRLGELEQQVRDDLESQGVAPEETEIVRSMYAMYNGQSFSNQLAFETWPIDESGIEDWIDRFNGMYDRLYGYSAPEQGITVTTLSVSGTGPRRKLLLPELEAGGVRPDDSAQMGRFPLRVSGGELVEASFYQRDALRAGNRISGPAVIEEEMTTTVVPPKCEAVVDPYGNLRIAIGVGA
jgi:N-methylhydantoinase A